MEDPRSGLKEGSEDSPEIVKIKRVIQRAYEKKLYLGKDNLSINRIKDTLYNKLEFNDFRDLGFDNQEEFMEFLENEDEYDSQNSAFYYITNFLEETTDALIDLDIRETALMYLHSEIHTIEGEEEWKDEKEPLYDFHLSTNDPDGRMIAFENIKPRAMSDIKYEEEKILKLFDNNYPFDELIVDIREKISIRISTEKIVKIAEEFIPVLRGRIENAFEDIRTDINLDFQVFMEAYYNVDDVINKFSSRKLLRWYVFHQNEKYKEVMEKKLTVEEMRMQLLLSYIRGKQEYEKYGKKKIGLYNIPAEILQHILGFVSVDDTLYHKLVLSEAFQTFLEHINLASLITVYPPIVKTEIAKKLKGLEIDVDRFLSLQLSERKNIDKLNEIQESIVIQKILLQTRLTEYKDIMHNLSFFNRYKIMKAFTDYLIRLRDKMEKNLINRENIKYLSPSEKRMIKADIILSVFDKNELWKPLMKMIKRNIGVLEAAIEEVEAQRIAVKKSVSSSVEMTPKEGKRRKFIKARLQYNFFKPSSSSSSSIIIKKKKKKRQGKQRLNKEVDQYW
jgi:hypothetical protein